MSRSLIDRFEYGISGRLGPPLPQAEIAMYQPIRERQMIELGKLTVKAQIDAGHEIARSNITNARMLSKEIEQQTQSFENAINKAGETISDAISVSTDQLSEIFKDIGEKVCAELQEIRWLLVQQNETLEKILDVLRNSRNYEAQQFVRQGLRHINQGEYEEAEERFLRALNNDSTDYQVLMNLGYIEIYKSNSANALNFFNKAIKLPDNLDSTSKSRTLLAIARLYFAKEDFEKALSHAEHALKQLGNIDARILYSIGVYAAHSGKESLAVEKISQSILINTNYFSKALGDPDLEIIRSSLSERLDQICGEALSDAKNAVNIVKHEIYKIDKIAKLSKCDDLFARVQKQFNKDADSIIDPTYSNCLRCNNNIRILQEAIAKIKKICSIYVKNSELEKQMKHLAPQGKVDPPGEPPHIITLSLIITYLAAAVSMTIRILSCVKDADPMMSVLGGLVWPITTVAGILERICVWVGVPGSHAGSPDYQLATGALVGIMVGFIISVLLWIVLIVRQNRKSSLYSKFTDLKKNSMGLSENIQEHRNNINWLFGEISNKAWNSPTQLWSTQNAQH